MEDTEPLVCLLDRASRGEQVGLTAEQHAGSLRENSKSTAKALLGCATWPEPCVVITWSCSHGNGENIRALGG